MSRRHVSAAGPNRSLWSYYERYLMMSGYVPLKNFITKEELRTKIKEGLVKELLELDRATLGSRLQVAKALTKEVVQALRRLRRPALIIDAETLGGLLPGSSQGLGTAVLEVGVSWDRVLDLPVIRGSSVKGAVRGFCIDLLTSRGLSDKDAENLCSTLLGRSGEDGHVGLISFADALPIASAGDTLLEADVINPHYNALARKGLKMELDVTPVPVVHLRVRKGVTFRFVAYARSSPQPSAGSDLLKLGEALGVRLVINDASVAAVLLTSFLLGGALRLGLGGRAMKGYGRFSIKEVRMNAGQ